MNLGSTRQNIHMLTMATGIVALIGLLNYQMFTLPHILLAMISFYVLNILGVWMTLHRYYSHKSFEFKNRFLKWTFTALAVITGRGSPMTWAYLHRRHHKYSDTDQDPHNPRHIGYPIFNFDHFKKEEAEKTQLFLIKDLMTSEQLFINKWYILILAVFCITFAVVNPVLFYFTWVIPAVLIQISQTNFNYFGHTSGYRNFETSDNSRNNPWLFPFILGEAWHNNHHNNPAAYSTTVNQREIDPMANFINIIKIKEHK